MTEERPAGSSGDPLSQPYELQTPWFPDPPPPPEPAPPLAPRRASAGAGSAADLAARLPAGWIWAIAVACVAAPAAVAASAHSSLLIPLVPTGLLLVLVAGVGRIIQGLASTRVGTDTSAVVAGVLSVLFGWIFGAWMLAIIPGAMLTALARPVPDLLLAAGALLGAAALPFLTVALALHSRWQGADARLALRLGYVSAAAAVLGAVVLILLSPPG